MGEHNNICETLKSRFSVRELIRREREEEIKKDGCATVVFTANTLSYAATCLPHHARTCTHEASL